MIIIITEGVTHRQIFDKSVQVKQLNCVEAHGILLLRVDKGKHFHLISTITNIRRIK